jgi:hypothetical protein
LDGTAVIYPTKVLYVQLLAISEQDSATSKMEITLVVVVVAAAVVIIAAVLHIKFEILW